MMNIVQWVKCELEADRRMKRHNGHRFEQILKNRCSSCGRSPKHKGKCSQWFKTFLLELEEVMCERGYLKMSCNTETKLDIYVEAFLSKLDEKGKTGIKLPKREIEAQKEKLYFKQLLDKKMISLKTYKNKIKEIDSVTLDDKMYAEFYDILKERQ